jgi:hypothetical protein
MNVTVDELVKEIGQLHIQILGMSKVIVDLQSQLAALKPAQDSAATKE